MQGVKLLLKCTKITKYELKMIIRIKKKISTLEAYKITNNPLMQRRTTIIRSKKCGHAINAKRTQKAMLPGEQDLS